MSTVTVFRQERVDGGIRTGIDYEGMTVLESFSPGQGENDPALLWYVDVRFESELLPSRSPQMIREWLVRVGSQIKPDFERLVRELETGIDSQVPVQRQLDTAIPTLKVSVVATGMRRLSARQIGTKLREFVAGWDDHLKAMEPPSLACA